MADLDTRPLARTAGMAYLGIIALGLWAEIGVRGALHAQTTPDGTLAALADMEPLARLAVAADATMVALDILLALLLFILLKPTGPLLAALATLMRLLQASVIAGTLTLQTRALDWATDPGLATALDPGTRGALAMQALAEQAMGYDLGLIFFGISSIAIGLLLIRQTHPILGPLMIAAGATYLTGSTIRLLAPHLSEAFLPAYGIAVVAELSLALWLLLRAGRPGHVNRREMVGDSGIEPLTSTM